MGRKAKLEEASENEELTERIRGRFNIADIGNEFQQDVKAAGELKLALWFLSKFESGDEALAAVEGALASVKLMKDARKKRKKKPTLMSLFGNLEVDNDQDQS